VPLDWLRAVQWQAGGDSVKKPLLLYHFTCGHGYSGIEESHRLRPNLHPFMPSLGPLLWLTDLAMPETPESVGLQSTWITCNRMTYRYIVRTGAARHWFEVRGRAPKDVVVSLEAYGQPNHWWVARRPLTPSEFTYDPTWKEVAV
jgi:hypothetical protein